VQCLDRAPAFRVRQFSVASSPSLKAAYADLHSPGLQIPSLFIQVHQVAYSCFVGIKSAFVFLFAQILCLI
jgi:hypothetical protein